MRTLDVVAAILTILYPAAVYFGLQWFEPRVLGLLLVTIVLLRHIRHFRSLLATLHPGDWLAIATLALLALAIVLFNNETLLLLYPACVSLAMLLTFARTLLYPPSMIERFARLSNPALSSDGVRYTRAVTGVWCLFFIVNGSVAAASTQASREWWLLYNGLISYVLMGMLFLVEWLIRCRVMPKASSTV